MKETFYQQIREFGILIETTPHYERWMVRGCDITVYFKDIEHKIIGIITL